MNPRTIRCGNDLCERITAATKARGFSSTSAFIRMAIENELRGRTADGHQAEDRAAASFERLLIEIRRLATGQQALFAFVDALTKTILTCVPEPAGEAYPQAIARAKARYDRFLKSVGSGMTGESGRALTELAERVER